MCSPPDEAAVIVKVVLNGSRARLGADPLQGLDHAHLECVIAWAASADGRSPSRWTDREEVGNAPVGRFDEGIHAS